MTEIVQNNNSMKFDLIETGNGSPGAAEGDSSFNAMLGSIDIRGGKNTQYEREATDKDTQTESYILDVSWFYTTTKFSRLCANKF